MLYVHVLGEVGESQVLQVHENAFKSLTRDLHIMQIHLKQRRSSKSPWRAAECHGS